MRPASTERPRALRAAWLALGLSACTWITGVPLQDETVTAACGMCVFKQDAKGCYWAIEHDGAYYAVNGPLPEGHDSHGPEGMCRMPRQAVVTGRIRGDQFFAERFDLLPVDPTKPPPAVEVHEHVHGPGGHR